MFEDNENIASLIPSSSVGFALVEEVAEEQSSLLHQNEAFEIDFNLEDSRSEVAQKMPEQWDFLWKTIFDLI